MLLRINRFRPVYENIFADFVLAATSNFTSIVTIHLRSCSLDSLLIYKYSDQTLFWRWQPCCFKGRCACADRLPLTRPSLFVQMIDSSNNQENFGSNLFLWNGNCMLKYSRFPCVGLLPLTITQKSSIVNSLSFFVLIFELTETSQKALRPKTSLLKFSLRMYDWI